MGFYTVLDGFVNQKLLELHTAMPAKIINVYENEADIQPLFMTVDVNGDVERYPLVLSVPWIKHRFKVNGETQVYEPVYEKGDLVLVVFAERALDHFVSDKPFDPEFHRHHDLNDAIIVGLL
jgi:Phage protein Gp138 N-terminal domain